MFKDTMRWAEKQESQECAWEVKRAYSKFYSRCWRSWKSGWIHRLMNTFLIW